MPLKIDYPTPPDWPEDEGVRFSPTKGDFETEDKADDEILSSRWAQDAALRRAGYDPDKVRRPPLAGHEDEKNEAGILKPREQNDLRNER